MAKTRIKCIPDLTASQVADELQIARDSVISLIQSGELVGFDASPRTHIRRQWRVTRDDLNKFKAARALKAKPKRRRAKQLAVGEHV